MQEDLHQAGRNGPVLELVGYGATSQSSSPIPDRWNDGQVVGTSNSRR